MRFGSISLVEALTRAGQPARDAVGSAVGAPAPELTPRPRADYCGKAEASDAGNVVALVRAPR
jgi:hypothetical protein